MAVLLLGEVTNGELSLDATAKTVAAAAPLGDVTVLCAGASAMGASEAAAVEAHHLVEGGDVAETQRLHPLGVIAYRPRIGADIELRKDDADLHALNSPRHGVGRDFPASAHFRRQGVRG